MKLSGEQLHVDRETQERSNPVFSTAKATAFQLAMSGDTDAAKLVADLQLTQSQTQSSKNYQLPQEMMAANLLMMETRFRTMMAMALDSGCKTEIDMPCGYTPRAAQITREGMGYVGLDLPVGIAEAEAPITELVDEDKRHLVRFAPVDATNYPSVRAALEGVEGPVCITTEGLMMYLTNSELVALCQTVRRVLEEFGGCWITPDPECSMEFFGILKLLAGPKALELLKTNLGVYSQKSDVTIGENFLIANRGDLGNFFREAAEKLASFGMKVERIPVAKHMPRLRQLDKLTAQQQEAYRALHENICYWKMTLIETGGVSSQWSDEAQGITMDAQLEGGKLHLTLDGRVDSISAPQLLALYERIGKEHPVESIHLDCGNLSYISSAGLRVLLIMEKAHPGCVVLSHVRDAVMEIMDQTGFSSILTIRD